ncbi:MAG: TonB-dependent receptor [Candidatus Dadabacteria bacterium]|nr:TonB-dependent receptor [Candidatus Dadabacteria bacterium]MYA48092.1 TonB-dependent receptor [Candidatus Dadabacteria bacterium]MYF48084.1 TonB-dependent receptor [Candidatus Dadabacteria bacterium]MYG83451.1 TonB-dependent receptor [Candidatus Dadabacteria bacterium]MYK49604.1 TonB-dependent receptor [Candidatus Dadabacteria bacterium]
MNFKIRLGVAIRFFAFLSLFSLVFSLTAVAQEGQDEQKESLSAVEEGSYTLQRMIVTATKRAQLAQDVPFSLNVQSEEDIKRLNTTDLEDLSRNVAGLSIQNLGPGQSVVTIRGISSGQIVRDQPGVKEQVGVYLDETPISLSLFTPDIDLFDLNRVETLRGPQGTLFGSGSIGGTVRYITNQPSLGVSEVKVEIDGNYLDEGSLGGHLKTALNVPLGEDAAVRLVAYGTRYGGFIDARKEGGTLDEDVNDGTRHGGRISLLWEPTENLSITPRIVYQNIDLGGFNRDEVFNLFANPYTDPPTPLGDREQYLLLDEAFEDETLIFDTVVNWSVEDFFDVTYSASYINRDLLVSRDASALTGSVSVDLGFAEDQVANPSNLRDTTDLEQMTHELRLSSNDDSSLQWLAGVFYSDVERDYSQRLPTPGYDALWIPSADTNFPDAVDSPYSSDLTYDLRQVALFGEATYNLLDRLGLTAGLRWYDWEEDKTFKSGGGFSNADAQNQDITVSSNGFTPRFMLSYDANDNLTVNAQASRGFRLGGVNDPLNQLLCGDAYDTFRGYQEFEDETLWNYEVGFKSSFENVTFNGSVFYTDIKNLGVNVDAGPCSSRVTISVPESHTAGAELELSLQATRSLLLAFAGSYLEAEFDSTIRTASGDVVEGIEKGNRIPSVPDWQLSGSATYTLPGFLNARESYLSASWQFVGDSITQSGDQVPGRGVFGHGLPYRGASADEETEVDLLLDSYHLFNLSAGLVYKSLEFTAYVKNLTDENVRLSFDRERGGRARLAYRVGQPRTFGVVTRMRF